MAAPRLFNPDKTRFENTEELKTVAELMKRMYQKETELSRAASMKNDDNSLDHKKQVIVTGLVEDANRIIADFNNVREPNDEVSRLNEIIAFANNIHALTKNILEQHAETLKLPRNKDLQNARTISYYGVMGVATTIALFQTFATGAPIVIASHFGSEQAKKTTGLNDPNAQSYRWIQELNDVVETIPKNLTLRLATMVKPAAGASLARNN